MHWQYSVSNTLSDSHIAWLTYCCSSFRKGSFVNEMNSHQHSLRSMLAVQKLTCQLLHIRDKLHTMFFLWYLRPQMQVPGTTQPVGHVQHWNTHNRSDNWYRCHRSCGQNIFGYFQRSKGLKCRSGTSLAASETATLHG
jgi:sugar phosphate permease